MAEKMKVAGFTFIRNAVKNDYPVVEAITSVLPICDEFIVMLGKSEDETHQLISGINSPKIRIIESEWDENLHYGGVVFAQETDKAFAAVAADADWAFYIQGDECIHEKYLPVVLKAMQDNLQNERVEGLLFKYLHFYGSYDYYGHSRRWYRREIRVLRNDKDIRSYRDAQGFRWKNNRKLNVKLIDAYIYHYGWVKPPEGLGNKVRNFNRFYHEPEWVAQHMPDTYLFDYGNADNLIQFNDTHPAVMKKRIAATNWKLDIDLKAIQKRLPLRRVLLQKVEELTGWRIGEYRNYRLIK